MQTHPGSAAAPVRRARDQVFLVRERPPNRDPPASSSRLGIDGESIGEFHGDHLRAQVVHAVSRLQ